MNASFEPTLNILAAYPVFKQKYGLSMQEDDFLEEAYQIFKDINSVPTQYYKYVQKPQSKDTMIIEVPCNLYKLLSITSAPLQSDGWDNIEPYKNRVHGRRDRDSFVMEMAGESDLMTYRFNDTPYTGVGTYLKFEWVDETSIRILDTNLWDKEIYMVYEGIKTDADGIPMITRKQANAIAAKVAHNVVMRKVFSGDANLVNLLPVIGQEAARLMQAAAIPEQLTDNQLDEMLNEHTSYERKRRGRSFKFRR